MAHSAAVDYPGIASRLALFERQLTQVREVVGKLDTLDSRFSQNSNQIFSDPAACADFKRDLEACRLTFAQIEDLTDNPPLNEISSLVKGRLEQLHSKLPISASVPLAPKVRLLQIAEKFKCHNTREALQEFSDFESAFPRLAGEVYGNLWRLKGSPMNLHPHFGHRAFHHLEGFCSQDNEKAEAIFSLYSPAEERLNRVIDLLNSGKESDAMSEFKEFEAVYPKIADLIFGKLWTVYGEPTHQSRPDIAYDQFGTLAFYGKHSKLSSDPAKKISAIQLAIPEVKKQLADAKLCSEQNRTRRNLRCVAVIEEQLAILKQGSYIAPSKTKRDIQASLQLCIDRTEICRDGGSSGSKKARFAKTSFEVRPQNCVELAYELARAGNKVNAMNFANSDVPGGAYLHHAGSQEEELFRCTGLPLALDQTHQAQKTGFYPIHRTAGPAGGLYTPETPLFRTGLGSDYQLIEEPAAISVGTFAAFNHPPLDYSNPHAPRLQGEALHWTREKVRTYLKSAYDHGDEILLMGAFGCGAFGNPPAHICELMMDVIETEYQGCFKMIIFAVLKDGAEGQKHNPEGNFIPFARIVKEHGGMAYGVNGELL